MRIEIEEGIDGRRDEIAYILSASLVEDHNRRLMQS
jgi:hypothetical protein